MLENGTPGRLWPVHLKPREDELLSSWLVRLASGHGLWAQSFCHFVRPHCRLWVIDTDFTDNQEILESLAEKTGTSLDRTLRTTLAPYKDILFRSRERDSSYSWIIREQTNGLQYCPWCLSEDERPYFRRRWRLGFNILCLAHHSLLIDRCLRCGAAVKLHRKISPAGRLNSRPIKITQCHQCLHDLRYFAVEQYRREVDLEEIKFQRFLNAALEQGGLNFEDTGFIYSYLFFAGLRQLATLVIGSRKSEHIQEALPKHFNLKRFINVSPKRGRNFSSLGVVERRGILEACRCLLNNWPDNFVAFYLDNGVSSRESAPPRAELPYWYFKVIREYLMTPRYSVTEEEVGSVIRYLKRKNIEPTYSELSKYLPHCDVYALMSRNNLFSKPRIIEKCPCCQIIATQYRVGRDNLGGTIFKCKACNQCHPSRILGTSGYPPETIQQAINLYSSKHSFREVAQTLSVHVDTIRRWYKKYAEQ